MDAGVAIACGHSIAGPAWAAIPFTSGETPLAYLVLKVGHERPIKHKIDWEENYENVSETTL
jgi:hypothetical protein